jgi:hypothetical protein
MTRIGGPYGPPSIGNAVRGAVVLILLLGFVGGITCLA